MRNRTEEPRPSRDPIVDLELIIDPGPCKKEKILVCKGWSLVATSSRGRD